MNIEEYRRIYRQMNSYQDVKKLAKEGYDEELLLVIYTEKHIRKVKRDYYKIKKRGRYLLRRWKKGYSFTRLAHEFRFSPLMMAQILLREHGYSKRQIREALRDYNTVRDNRIRRELALAIERDMVYSQLGTKIQKKRGREGEDRIRKWLERKHVPFKEEVHLKGSGKTVDFLLEKPLKIDFEDGSKNIFWIESKASFGDMQKIKRDYEKQLKSYRELWGPGIVVYWFGYLDGMELWLEARDIKIVRKEWFG